MGLGFKCGIFELLLIRFGIDSDLDFDFDFAKAICVDDISIPIIFIFTLFKYDLLSMINLDIFPSPHAISIISKFDLFIVNCLR